MNQAPLQVKRALLSVSDRAGLAELAEGLHGLGTEIVSTGGTAAFLRERGIPVTDIAALTHFPEMMDGRVKTLHPAVHGGILGLRDMHAQAAETHHIEWIDLVVVNLYPFAETVVQQAVLPAAALEQIDIGGPAMIRSAAKNMGWVGVVVSPSDYAPVLTALKQGGLSFELRRLLAARAFSHTAAYDARIADWLQEQAKIAENGRGKKIKNISLIQGVSLRYGENPHQTASAWQTAGESGGILAARQWQGKSLSFNNIVDADAALACVEGLSEPACVIVKHATPCGVAEAGDMRLAFAGALATDPVSAFGGIVAFNRCCTGAVAADILETFFEVLVAPNFSPEALVLLAKKPALRVLQVRADNLRSLEDFRPIRGGMLVQSRDGAVLSDESLSVVTDVQPEAALRAELLFAFSVARQVKSNAIVLARDRRTVGIGGGQVSRVDAVKLALQKAGGNTQGSVLASDAFFPFRDSIDLLAGHGIQAIVQPGGSLRDTEVIAACNEQGIAMVFTGVRCFRH